MLSVLKSSRNPSTALPRLYCQKHVHPSLMPELRAMITEEVQFLMTHLVPLCCSTSHHERPRIESDSSSGSGWILLYITWGSRGGWRNGHNFSRRPEEVLLLLWCRLTSGDQGNYECQGSPLTLLNTRKNARRFVGQEIFSLFKWKFYRTRSGVMGRWEMQKNACHI